MGERDGCRKINRNPANPGERLTLLKVPVCDHRTAPIYSRQRVKQEGNVPAGAQNSRGKWTSFRGLNFGASCRNLCQSRQQDQTSRDLFLICGAEVARALFSVESNHRIGKAAPVLELRNVSLSIEHDGEPRPLIADVTTTFPRSHFAAILGPSGCGKSTLLKVITGIAHGTEEGHIYWDGRDLIQHDFSPSEIGYVPQFSIAHEDLTVRECVSYSIKLRVRGMGGEALEEAIARILEEVNMTEFADRLVRVLSGGQKRRLALAMELASKPAMLLCDEVTSGLDPQSEDEIVNLLRGLSRSEGRTVLSVTHSLNHLGFYDSVLVLFRGIVAYHGPPEFLAHYFHCEDPHDLFSQLTRRDAAEWADSWKKHRHPFEEAMAGQVPVES